MSESIPPGTIHFNESYLNYEYKFNGFPTILAIIPWFYMLPTLIIISRIFSIYLKTDWNTLEPGKNQHVFLVISLSLIFSFLFFIFDYIEIRLPATGIFTSFCARIPPNHWLKMIIFISFYTNYSAMAFPFFMPVIRLIILMFPKDFNKLTYYLFYGTDSMLAYSIVLRPFGNELQICMVAWIFYRSHPVFKKALVDTEFSLERRDITN
uniref:Serpentine receptor class gamma n=1 Tax=Caenorhabditis tropicalis TaxID=1561998 RepID=A0A1I7UDD6_9PELO